MDYTLIAIVAVIAVIVLWGISTYNSLIGGRNSVEEAFSGMDVFLKQRYDLIPNLVETVKGYCAHEKDTLTAVIEARAKAVSGGTIDEKLAADQNLSGALSRLFALSEAYPDLKANTNFIDLQNQLKDIEGQIATSRTSYNRVVVNYNNKVSKVPSNIIAGLFKFERATLFEIVNPVERENVKVQF